MDTVLAKKMGENKIILALRKVFMSKIFVAVQVAYAMIIILIQGDSKTYFLPIVYGIIGYLIVESLILFVCDDIVATLPIFMFISTISIKCYNSFGVFIKFWYLLILAGAALIFHFVVYRRRFVKGEMTVPYLLVSIAVTLGGLGSISISDYFNGTVLYYTIGLGFGMLFTYLLLCSCLHTSVYYILRMRLSYTMIATGIICVFMMAHHYFLRFGFDLLSYHLVEMQWRNNVSTILLMAMPFAFYVSTRKKKHIYFYLGLLEYGAILLSTSRGGAMFGTIELALCLIVLIYTDKLHRTENLIVITAATIIVCVFARPIYRFFDPLIERFVEGDDIRSDHIRRAISDFKSNVIFGQGFAYKTNGAFTEKKMAVNWYHSSPFQVIGSFGLLGVGAFGYQFYSRCRLFLRHTTHFNLTLFISFIGLTMMSTVNPGEFCPMPYAFLIAYFLVVCEKCNAASKRENGNETEEVLIKYNQK